MTLTRDQIIAADDRETREVDVPEWGGTVKIRALSGWERDNYEKSIMKFQGDRAVPDMANATAKLLARCIVDDKGERLFTDKEIGDLGRKSSQVMSRLYDVAAELSGLTEKAAEDAEGKSEAEAGDDSASS